MMNKKQSSTSQSKCQKDMTPYTSVQPSVKRKIYKIDQPIELQRFDEILENQRQKDIAFNEKDLEVWEQMTDIDGNLRKRVSERVLTQITQLDEQLLQQVD